MRIAIDPDRCVACLACIRVCPTDAIIWPPEAAVVEVMDRACILCGECLPACPHDAIRAEGALGRALAIAEQGDGALLLSPEAVAHFPEYTPEQLVNACLEAGFRLVSRGVLGDELVAAEYLRWWEDPDWGTLIRSTDPVVVTAITDRYPELVPYLVPVTYPSVAEARLLRSRYGAGLRVVYVGVGAPTRASVPELDALLSFDDLERLLVLREVRPDQMPQTYSRLPLEHRRHLSVAGGLPLEMVVSGSSQGRRLLSIRGVESLSALARAVSEERLDLGFVDILSHQGAVAHPVLGPREEVHWRRMLLQQSEPSRSRTPVIEGDSGIETGGIFPLQGPPAKPNPVLVQGLLKEIGLGPNGRPLDCRACGYDTCARFAEAAALGHASLRQCAPWVARQGEEALRDASTDALTGLASYRTLQGRLLSEVERSKRSMESFAVLFVDLDRMKQLNDLHGHERGNDALRMVASELRGAIRATDLAARYGGDEFVVLLTRTDRGGAMRVADLVRQRVEAGGLTQGFPAGMVSVSIGLAEYDPASPPEGDLLEEADRALYLAKSGGRNTVV